jgi:23S rRNA (cytidine1920-2'-O)/16S rRNA (cytidine1409-2'-O)-methyltransferase
MAGTKRKRERLDRLLIERQLLGDDKLVQSWIMSGAVQVNGQKITKTGTLVNTDADIVIGGLDRKYASRGGYKLEAALESFRFPVNGKVVLDAGAATGGFTDCLLQHGAELVYAVDVGFGQLRGSLAACARVKNMERTNIGDLEREDLAPPIDLCVVDLSYLSLTKAIPILKALFERPCAIICLIKPLFEGVSQDRKNSLQEFSRALDRVFEAIRTHALTLSDLIVSPVLGSRGTIEFLGLLQDSTVEFGDFNQLRDSVLGSVAERFTQNIDHDEY